MKLSSQFFTPLSALVLTSMALFGLTLLIGLWAAYDLGAALLRFSAVGGGLGLMAALAWLGRYHAKTILGFAGVGCAFWGAGLSVAYALRFNTNSGAVASGLLALLPLAGVGVWWQWQRRQAVLVWFGSVALMIGAIVFLATVERTAWIGFAVGVAGAGYLYWRWRPTTVAYGALCPICDGLLVLGIGSGILLYLLLLLTPTWDDPLGRTAIGGELLQRLGLWRESLALSRDYYFTGSGLGMTALVYSTYVLAIHDPYWYHAHNLYLQIALEQGLPGLFAFLMLSGLTLTTALKGYRKSGGDERWFWLAAITALLAILTYGLLDAELYATATVATLFLSFGFVLALHWAQVNQQSKAGWVGQAALPAMRRTTIVVGLMPILALALLCSGPGAGEKFYTNLGVLSQTKAELHQYHWPTWPIQDEMRRKKVVDLATTTVYYQTVLQINPFNATVHARLGQIALSQGNYPVALAHLKEAYRVAPTRDSIRRLLGEVYAVTGDVQQAAMLWRSVHLEYSQVKDRLWWYGYLKANQEVQWIQQALAQLQLVGSAVCPPNSCPFMPRSYHEALVLDLYKTA